MSKAYDRLWHNAGLNRVPLTGAFELLPVCNFSCKMCYVRKSMSDVNAMGGLLPAEFWLDIVRQAYEAGLLFPLLTGGEPFLYPDFQKLMAEMLSMGLMVSINSNASMIDEPMAEWLSKYRPTRINITLYGASAKTYQNLCGNGDAFARVRRGVELLKHHNIPVKFNTSITPYNVHELEDIITYAKSTGYPIDVASYMFPPVRRDSSMVGTNDRLSPKDAALAKVRADMLLHEPEWLQKQAARFQRFVPLTEELKQELSSKAPREMECRAGRCSFWVDWQGRLSACGMNSQFNADIRTLGFAESWKQVVEHVNALRYSSVCSNCPNHSLCHACAAMVQNETGTLDGIPKYLCAMHEYVALYYRELVGEATMDSSLITTDHHDTGHDGICDL